MAENFGKKNLDKKNLDKEKNFVSAVIYVHNAKERIGAFLSRVREVLEKNFEHAEIICVNDASDDGSADAIRACSRCAGNVGITLVTMSFFHGLELAMTAGVDLAIGDFVFEFDHAVMDYSPDTIMAVYRRALEGYDVVSASPDKKEKLSSRIFYRVFDRFSDYSYGMATESFRILSRRAINRVSSMNETILYRKALYAHCGLPTDTQKYKPVWPEDGEGRSSRGISDKRERAYRSGLAVDSLIVFTKIGYRFSMMMTMGMMLISIFVLGYTVVTYLTAHPVEGWTTTVLFLSVSFFGLFGILTVIVKYLQLLIDMVFKRKHYSFENIEKLTK